jgi:NAD(P)-dependent dehydrogenase (short-subunit alcohol dehydrogenase family)
MVISEEIDLGHSDSEAVGVNPVTSRLTGARPARLKRKTPGTSSIRSSCHCCTSKAAVVMLGRAMALELGAHSIRVNAVLPDYINVAESGRRLSSSYRESARVAALGRPGTPEDVARAVLLLASPLADYVSGATLVDGGARAGLVGLRPVDDESAIRA